MIRVASPVVVPVHLLAHLHHIRQAVSLANQVVVQLEVSIHHRYNHNKYIIIIVTYTLCIIIPLTYPQYRVVKTLLVGLLVPLTIPVYR
jgi:hypothetical protein